MSRKSSPGDLDSLPPIARAEAMDRPYRPGRTRRQVLLGLAVVGAMVMLFLWLMPRGPAPSRAVPGPAAASAPTPAVVYQNLRVAPAAPPPRAPEADAAKQPSP